MNDKTTNPNTPATSPEARGLECAILAILDLIAGLHADKAKGFSPLDAGLYQLPDIAEPAGLLTL